MVGTQLAVKQHDSVQRILNSAGRCFGRDGYEGASMSDIARTAAVSKALLHYHFQSKEQLYMQVIRKTCAGFLVRLQEIATGGSGSGNTLEHVLEEVLEFVEKDLTNVSLMLEFRGVVHKNEDLTDHLSGFHTELVGIIVRGIESALGDLKDTLFIPSDRLARLLLLHLKGTVAGLVFAASDDEREKVREAYRDMARLLSRTVRREAA